MFNINIIKRTEGAKRPTISTGRSAGWDLYSSEDVLISAKSAGKAKTGIAIDMGDRGIYGRIAEKSGWAFNPLQQFLILRGGVIDR